MKQRALTVVTRIARDQVASLDALLTQIGDHVNDNPYVDFSRMSSLHFASWVMVAFDPEFPPQLVLETSYDGELEQHLDELLAHGGRAVDAIYAHCEGYPAADGRDPRLVKDYLRTHAVPEAAFLVGLPGQTVASLLNAIDVRQEVQRYLDDLATACGFDGLSPKALVDRIARHLLGPSPVRPAPSEVPLEQQRAIAFRNAILMALAGVPLAIALSPLLAIFLAVLRVHEVRDRAIPPPPTEPIDPRLFSQEDMFVQNHLATVVKLKPGFFRRWTVKGVMAFFDVFAGAIYRDGNVGGNPTIHFLRTFMMDDDQRVALFSNYDGSWANYLGDFADQMVFFLNAAFGNTEGFPAVNWLIGGGARDIAAYKQWTRERSPYTHVWYSAYPNVTIQNAQKDLALRDGILDDRRADGVAALLRVL
jgi:hypothetical protein